MIRASLFLGHCDNPSLKTKYATIWLHIFSKSALICSTLNLTHEQVARMQDKIQREIMIKATKERIYEAIANPEKVVLWFPETLEGSYKVGEQLIFGFGEHGKNQVYVEAARPHEYFAYRWVPGCNHFLGDVLAVPNTLVEFHIETQADNICKLTLTETGFSKLPAELIEKSVAQNSNGWEFMLGRLEKYFAEV